ncbi:N-acetylmannosamine-6-phosphate 2-epimerase [Listeria seeligeri]|nr:N-acetylmannosamine-6-phosphate 2-epimerase [Listeria seeligeri]MBC1442554.1 N-acetylmannosamine-6-phosphate 2-epimerase [Listeria seeligeri]MBC1532226.1 N-acetylmannosamine-6-phosphate 2-epimerase [Listeria seeligeri]MBC1537535.1 N-acetylmannosamine-6-phosphate 2-epimerase [Listeria seeligeri]MBC1542155.1 N-acetylmannosamine-6-phosphate 2-epimerase [Listeria seeligeri]MBC1555234.1 N-acetylmannosamine-6-phosphate 2-epimerase [Listeria seeligeri]
MNNSVLEKIKGELIVSCQALPDEPLHSSFIMSKMALAAVQGGAIGIRANTAEDISAIQNEVNVPIIGILKQVYDDCDVFITPTLKEVREICETGAEIVAMDATTRPRPNNENLEEILQIIRKEFPHTLLMADTGSMEDVHYADSLGFDLIGTTLYGYTDETANQDISNHDFYHLKEVLKSTKRPVIAEGKIDSPEKASEVLKLGCHAVVVGGAITRPQEITTRFTKKIKGIL